MKIKMTKKSKTVFLTGVTGNMGRSAMELLLFSDKFNLKVLARDSRINRKKLAKYPQIEVIWGDLCNYEDVLKGVVDSDYVLHIGGMVSPQADKFPELTMKVNVSAAKNVVKAVESQANKDDIKVVYIGSVAQTGFRPYPRHWGRTGDPQTPSLFDMYSLSKIEAERIFCESSIKNWVSVRQSGMLYPELLLKGTNPITFHVPFDGVLEWTTIEDSGKALLRICEDGLPEKFWRSFYNLGSGENFRLTNYEFESLLMSTLGLPGVEKIFELEWFATHNFHGQWYLDSDLLEDYLHFREDISVEDYFKRIKKSLPWYFSLAPIAPAFLIKFFMRQIAKDKEDGTLGWAANGNIAKINAYFGSVQEMKNIGTWKNYTPIALEKNQVAALTKGDVQIPDHGYDDTKSIEELGMEDFAKVAASKGGELLSVDYTGNNYAPLNWKCQEGHKFYLSPNSVLKGGHWCSECLTSLFCNHK